MSSFITIGFERIFIISMTNSSSPGTKSSDVRKFLVMHLNSIVKTTWTDEEQKKGKVVPIKWTQHKEALSIVPLYTDKGWIITHQVMLDHSGRTLILNIKRPPSPW